MSAAVDPLVELPTFDEAQEACDTGGPSTALERFIYREEPSGGVDEARFRRGLVEVLSEALTAQLAARGDVRAGLDAALEASNRLVRAIRREAQAEASMVYAEDREGYAIAGSLEKAKGRHSDAVDELNAAEAGYALAWDRIRVLPPEPEPSSLRKAQITPEPEPPAGQREGVAVPWDGVPLNPGQEGWHWLKRKRWNDVSPWLWTDNGEPDFWWAEEGGEGAPEEFARDFTYVGPCAPPSGGDAAEVVRLEHWQFQADEGPDAAPGLYIQCINVEQRDAVIAALSRPGVAEGA